MGPSIQKSAEKAATFIQLCNKRNIPLIFLQNVTGFLVERISRDKLLLKKDLSLLMRCLTLMFLISQLLLGHHLEQVHTLCRGEHITTDSPSFWPTAKIAVMGSKQIAGVMSIVRRGQAARKGEKFDEKQDAEIVKMVEQMSDQMSEVWLQAVWLLMMASLTQEIQEVLLDFAYL